MTRLRRALRRTPAPPWLIAAYLSVRWRCRVSPSARVRYPLAVTLGRGARVGRATIIASGNGVELGTAVEIGDGALFDAQGGRITVGPRSAIGPFVVVYGEGTVSIGADVSIATHSTVVALNHIFDDRDSPIRRQGASARGIRIEDDVWVSANCVLVDGITLQHGSVVAAGAVVTKSVAPYTVISGIPAKFLRDRGPHDTAPHRQSTFR